MQNGKASFGWLWKMALRDSRKSRGRLLLMLGSVVLGIAALASLRGFEQQLAAAVDQQGQELLGADLQLQFTDSLSASADSLLLPDVLEQASEKRFASMARFFGAEVTAGSRLIQVRAATAVQCRPRR